MITIIIDITSLIGERQTSINLLLSAGLSYEAVTTSNNKAPASLKDYVELSIHDKEAK